LKAALLAEFERIPFNRYPPEQPFELMRRLEEVHHLEEGSVLVGNGSNDLTQTLGLCFVSDGTPVVLPRPMFALFESVVRMHGGQIVSIRSGPDFRFDMDAIIEAAARPETALTIVASPNNPTGLAVPFSRLKELCERAPGFVVVDEAYQEFNTEPGVASLLASRPNLLVMRTLSKVFGLAGLRLGYLMGHPRVMAELLKARIPFTVDRLSERTALALLDHAEVIEARIDVLRAGIKWISEQLSALTGVTVLPTTTNFLLFRTERNARQLASELGRRGVVIRLMSGYSELPDYLRVNAGTEPENKAFVAALKQILDDTD
jgi:histidinol-phosphate aminotransferase